MNLTGFETLTRRCHTRSPASIDKSAKTLEPVPAFRSIEEEFGTVMVGAFSLLHGPGQLLPMVGRRGGANLLVTSRGGR